NAVTQKSRRRRRCAFTGRLFRRLLSSQKANRCFSPVKGFGDRYSRSRDLGKEKATGGPKPLGLARNGMSRYGRCVRNCKRNMRTKAKTRRPFIVFIKTCGQSAGSWKESTIEVRGTARFVCLQFPRRSFAPRRCHLAREGTRDAGDCLG